ncbi:MAG: sodium-translocating pyrophosphatase [SAR86 cluster bacterium]|jgi:K(+)-stimulated pyrophosphate-energized sodium pump|nr:sodium-translocating pyrophosphatase [SAR86 cluster bacterium]|tara:strand:+ start:10211 stop:12220 length:2010 start_codon:yes stop_codon:yes gene_type:complete
METLIIGPMDPWGPFATGFIGLIFAFILYGLIMKFPAGKQSVVKIGDQIHLGAKVFMITEYKILAPVVLALVLACGLSPLGWYTALAIAVGALSSAIAGFIGMYSATKANVRTATAAENHGQEQALSISFFGGSIMGLCVASMGLVGLGGLFFYFSGVMDDLDKIAKALEGFGVGASAVALFSRVGGGIFTKSADVGADLVGKIEAGIPEDDPRNPGVIADNVGDNVGDIAGMGSDIFESYCGAMIASIAIAATMLDPNLMFLPLWLAASGLFCSLIGIGIVRTQVSRSPAVALRWGTFLSPVIFLVFAGVSIYYSPIEMKYFYSVLTGAVGGILIGLITEYYTGGDTENSPVGKIAKSGETGPATVMITGLSVGMQSVVLPLFVIAGIVGLSTYFSGLYGVGIAAVGMLSTVGITMAIDAYGPVADNAGGIAEMSGMKSEVREITDSLDELGNTTAAIGKGFAIGAAALAALAIIAAYMLAADVEQLSLDDPKVLMGMFIGGSIPFLVSSITMTAVGDAAFEMIEEIRRQFREIPGLLEGKAEPDNAKCVDIATKAALNKMLLPGAIAILSPVIIGFVLGPIHLGGMLAGALLGCVLMALMMANAGGAWDNAKKFVEKGNFGGKGTDTHSATVVGDTVGDPFKDTSGPSMNILINVMAIVSLVIAPLL